MLKFFIWLLIAVCPFQSNGWTSERYPSGVMVNQQDPHEAVYRNNEYPSAQVCKSCHPQHYEEWSVSPHAYAMVSPVLNAMSNRLMKLTNGTQGDFCMRCHTPVGMQAKNPVFMAVVGRSQVVDEGVTCIVCHRRDKNYGKVSGRIAIKKGDIFEPMYGPFDNKGLKYVINSGKYDVNTQRGIEGKLNIHRDAHFFAPIKTAAFCAACHDVNQFTGARLEETFSDFKSSPAARKGISCQDCHMGQYPGRKSGFDYGPVAIVGGIPTSPRQRTNHLFVGPDYSVVSPGLFPQSIKAQFFATKADWVQFNEEAGWGIDDFEDKVTKDFSFPPRWAKVEDRYTARKIIDENKRLLAKATEERVKLFREAYRLGDVIVQRADKGEIVFKVQFKNGIEGHSAPIGFDNERVVFFSVTVYDVAGKVVFKSGDLDPNGDLRDIHSLFVQDGKLPLDRYLFNLKGSNTVRMAKGPERDQILGVGFSNDSLPFIRPSTQANVLLGKALDLRESRHFIPPLHSVWPRYVVTRQALDGSQGPYTVNIKLIAGMIPVNLVHEISHAGFDYGLTPTQVAHRVVDGYITVWDRKMLLTPGRHQQESNPLNDPPPNN